MIVFVTFSPDEPPLLHALAKRLRKLPLAAFVLTGGDTAAWVLRMSEARAIRLDGVLRSGIPFGRILGGMFDGLRVVTKSGSFGSETTLADIARFLRN
jgi:uncharacterized protein YgbK (DUF1537 family)